MTNKSLLFHAPIKSNEELTPDQMYCGQKVKIIGWFTVYEDKEKNEDLECSTGGRCEYLGKKGYLDSFLENGIPDMIVLKDEALIIKNFKIQEIQ